MFCVRKGYMDNVLSIIDPNNRIFESEKYCTSDFNEGYLTKIGKEINKFENIVLERTVLLDDKIRYHKPQPNNGILVNPFPKQVTEYANDKELLRLFPILLHCLFFGNVTEICPKYNNQKYNDTFFP